MRVLIINTSERVGGAAVAASRLMESLNNHGVEARMLVRDKQSKKANVSKLKHKWLQVWNFIWERMVIWITNRFTKRHLFAVDIANTGTDITSLPEFKQADVIHLHWINQGMLSLHNLKQIIASGKPIVWTMHDMWPCTSICHHSLGCNRFKTTCNCCPLLSNPQKHDLSYQVFQKKQFLNQSKIQLIAVSSWLKQQAKESALTHKLAIDVIPNVIDTQLFVPSDKEKARQELSLPLDKKIILMGAVRINDPIKGFSYLIEALTLLSQKEKMNRYHLVLFGGIKGDHSFLSKIPISYTWLGLLDNPHTIVSLYAAADVTVVSSLYETFGQTIIEGMACGCPAVSFNNSGQTDIIDHLKNGYLANYKDSADLANGIEWVLSHNLNHKLSTACQQKVSTHYSESIIAQKYKTLYKQLICKSQSFQS